MEAFKAEQTLNLCVSEPGIVIPLLTLAGDTSSGYDVGLEGFLAPVCDLEVPRIDQLVPLLPSRWFIFSLPPVPPASRNRLQKNRVPSYLSWKYD